MNTIAKLLLAAAAAVPGVVVATAAQAQVGGVAVADPQGAVANTKAWAAARGQIESTYKAQLDQAQARRQAISTELTPLVNAFNTARAAPNVNQASLQSQAQAIQTKEQAGQQEIDRITQPAQRAQAYAIEQIQAKLPDAVQNVVRAKNVSLLISPQATLFMQPAADITPAVTTELDRLVPTVGITPPANWQPGQAGAAAAGSAPTPTAAAPAAATPRRSGGR